MCGRRVDEPVSPTAVASLGELAVWSLHPPTRPRFHVRRCLRLCYRYLSAVEAGHRACVTHLEWLPADREVDR